MNIKQFFLPLIFILSLLLTQSCAQMKTAQTSIGQAIDNSMTVDFDWGQVYCGRGSVCAEIEVVRVDFANRDGGRVEVTLHNRTGLSVAAQIALEIVTDAGVRIDASTYQDIALPPRQETVWEMPGIYHKGAKIRVLLRQRTNKL